MTCPDPAAVIDDIGCNLLNRRQGVFGFCTSGVTEDVSERGHVVALSLETREINAVA